jgi:trehalose 6-phosphate synthase
MLEQFAPPGRTGQQGTLDWLKEISEGTQLIVLANREPFTHERDATGRIVVARSSSGVVNAVEPLVASCGGVWVAHGSGSADRETVTERDGLNVPAEAPRYRLRRVWLREDEEQGYYYGFANEALWPLCHRAHVRPTFRSNDLETYWRVNGRFADAVCEEATTDSPIILVQDYHFALAPLIIRDRLPLSTIVTFWHVPWPHWQSFEICPWRHQIIEGLLGSSIVGFQTEDDCRNFVETVEHTLEARIDRDGRALTRGGRRVLVRSYPASVPWTDPVDPTDAACAVGAQRVEETRAAICQQLGLDPRTRLGVGVDRLDYTKGLEEKFLAIERLLECYPEFVERFVFVQLAEPSRVRLPAYVELRARVLAAAERVNSRFGNVDYCPIVLLEAHHAAPDVLRFLRAADVCFVGSLHDGMNLVSKEFVRARDDERGVLVLSAFTGAARELNEALQINPYDADGTAAALAAALMMSEEEQQGRMRRLRATVGGLDAHRWGALLLSDAARLGRQRTERTGVPFEMGFGVAAS